MGTVERKVEEQVQPKIEGPRPIAEWKGPQGWVKGSLDGQVFFYVTQ